MIQQDKIVAIVQRLSGKREIPAPDESLFESGYLDSFALADVVVEIEKEFGVRIPDSDLTPRTFDSIARIENYLGRHTS